MMPETRGQSGSQTSLGRALGAAAEVPMTTSLPRFGSSELAVALAEVKGQAQFLLYLTDQIEESIQQLGAESDPGQAAFLCRLLGMYASQLETKHQGLGEKVAETCQEVYVAVREYEIDLES
jgi:hypothetical protein